MAIHFFTFDPSWFKSDDPSEARVVLFDGVCGLCNRTVNTLLAIDLEGRLRFAPLQGEYARDCLGAEARADLESIVYLRGDERYDRSDAVLWICRDLGGPWALAVVFLSIPRPLRDGLYNFIARNRYAIFGKIEACRIPSPEERARSLD